MFDGMISDLIIRWVRALVLARSGDRTGYADLWAVEVEFAAIPVGYRPPEVNELLWSAVNRGCDWCWSIVDITRLHPECKLRMDRHLLAVDKLVLMARAFS